MLVLRFALALSLVAAPLAGAAVAQELPQGAPDAFHPDVDPGAPAEPAYGGRLLIHLEVMPARLNRVVDNSAVVEQMGFAYEDTLLHQDWRTYELVPRLATSWEVTDQLLLLPHVAADYGDRAREIGTGKDRRFVLLGEVTEAEGRYRVQPAEGEPILVPAMDVAGVERGTVLTFHLREGVTFHDGHPFDAHDVVFTWECYQNPDVDCDEKRSLYAKMIHAEALGEHTVRVVHRSQFYAALEETGEMPILPRHVYDLRDPDHSAFDPDATPTSEDVARSVNVNDANRAFIGLGAYRITEATSSYIEVERYDDYWDAGDPVYGGYLDVIRWRNIGADQTAFQALINGEIDLNTRISSTDYFGEATAVPSFTDEYYKGYVYTGIYAFVAWNAKRPFFRDVDVRHALALAFDMDEHLASFYQGLGRRVSGPPNVMGPAYDDGVTPVPHDPDLAEELLAEAGWYDRDGDGVLDKDGIPFEFTYLYANGNNSSKTLGLKLQEAYAALGIRMNVEAIEWATLLERMNARDFDAVNSAWQPDVESDPEQVWHSRWAEEGLKSSNYISYSDEETDRLIAAIQREVDRDARMGLWHQLHARIASRHPYLFMAAVPRKFALHKRFRGFRASAIAPGYNVREIHLPAGTPGTRPTPERD